MSKEQFARTEKLLGKEAVQRLFTARVAVFGIGGVGGYAVEALARSGVGALDLIDSDTVCESNLNRQIIALHSTIGRSKTADMRERIFDINPQINVNVYDFFFLPQNAGEFPVSDYDYVVDAVDTVTAKLELILRAKEAGVPIISCMGAGNKLDPTQFRVADIYQTKICPLAKVMRRELKKRGVEQLKVVYSEEEPVGVGEERPTEDLATCKYMEDESGYHGDREVKKGEVPQADSRERRSTPGSIAFVPSVAGLILAGEVIKDIAFGRFKD